MRIRQVLERKDRNPLSTVSADATAQEAIRIMCANQIGALLVTDAQRHLQGIITHRDILRQCCEDCRAIERITVSQLMTKNTIIGHMDDDVHDTLAIMSAKRVRHLPIVEDDAVIGIVTMGDILRALYQADEIKIHQLSDYLGGTYGLKVY